MVVRPVLNSKSYSIGQGDVASSNVHYESVFWGGILLLSSGLVSLENALLLLALFNHDGECLPDDETVLLQLLEWLNQQLHEVCLFFLQAFICAIFIETLLLVFESSKNGHRVIELD